MENLVKIAEGVLVSCLAVKPGEEVLIVTDDSRIRLPEILAAKRSLWLWEKGK